MKTSPRSLKWFVASVFAAGLAAGVYRLPKSGNPSPVVSAVGPAPAAAFASATPAPATTRMVSTTPAATASAFAPASVASAPASEEDAAATAKRLTFGTQWQDPQPAAPALTAFVGWTNRYLAAPADGKKALVAEGVALAQSRRAAFADLIRFHPADALADTVPVSVRAALPAAVDHLLEKRVSGVGDLALVGSTALTGSPLATTAATFRTATVDGVNYQAHVYGRREQQMTKKDISVAGVAVDGDLAVSESPVRVLEPGEEPPTVKSVQTVCPVSGLTSALPAVATAGGKSAIAGACGPVIEVGGRVQVLCCASHVVSAEHRYTTAEDTAGPYSGALSPQAFTDAAGSTADTNSTGVLYPPSWTEGVKKALFILVDFSDLPGRPTDDYSHTPVTTQYVLDVIYSTRNVDGFLRECSYGKTSLTVTSGDVTGVLRMPQTAAYYASGGDGSGNASQIHQDAEAAATNAGFTPANYDRIVVFYSYLGNIAGSQITYGGLGQIEGRDVWLNGFFSTLNHEFGHTYGLQHANLYKTTDGKAASPNGTSIEYGDPSDTMGNGYDGQEYNMWSRNVLGWMPDASVNNVTASGTYRVYRFDAQNASPTGPLALKIPSAVTGDSLHDYWIGLRETVPSVGANSNLYHSAYVLWGYHYSRQSDLLDMNTPGNGDASDAGLQIGHTFSENGITLQPLATGGTAPNLYMDVQITLGSIASVASSTVSVDENAGVATVTLYRSGSSTGTFSVKYATAAGTGASGSLYKGVSGTVTWASGDTAPKTITVQIVPGSVPTGSKTFSINLSGASGGLIAGGQSSITVKVQAPGTLDPVYASNTSDYPPYFAPIPLPQPDGSLLVLLSVYDQAMSANTYHLGRIDPAGGQDDSFTNAAVLDGNINQFVQQPDGKLLVTGTFTHAGTAARNGFARLNADGSLDTSLTAPASAANSGAVTLQPDGKILVGGSFPSSDGTASTTVERLKPDGTLDTAFTPPNTQYVDGVSAIMLQPDGKILVGGTFYYAYDQTSGGFPCGITRLNTNGTRDSSFYPGTVFSNGQYLGAVNSVGVQQDGSIVVGGQFDVVDGASHLRLARLKPNGSLDTAFNPSFANPSDSYPSVTKLIVQADGRIVAGGTFTQADSVTANHLARVNADGTLDTAFTLGGNSNDYVLSLAMENDGAILEGGYLYPGGNGTNYHPAVRLFSGMSTHPGVVQFAGAQAIGAAAGSTVSLQVTRTGGSDKAVSIDYATQAGSAVAGTDFTAKSGTLTWAAGDSAAKTITVPITAASGSIKTFSVNLGVPVGGVFVGALQAVNVRINGASAPPKLSLPNSAVTATENASFSYQIVCTGSGNTYSADGLPFGLTLNPSTGVISGKAAETGSFNVGITVSNIYGTDSGTLKLTINTATSSAGTLQFGASSYSVNETAGSVTATIGRSGGSTGAVTVVCGTTSGTAKSGTDYLGVSKTLSWAAGDTAAKSFTVSIKDVGLADGSTRSFSLKLSTPTGSATLGSPSTANVTIHENDPVQGELEFTAAGYSVNETAGSVTVQVKRTVGSTGAVSVTCATSAGTAKSGTDYSGVSKTLSWAAGDTAAKSFSVTIKNRGASGGNGLGFSVKLSAPTGGAILGSPTTATITIN